MENNEKLQHLRHSFAHLLAAAVMELYPDAKRTIGPAIETGFYYDFEFKNPISEKDLPKIEQKMRELVKKWHGFERQEVSKDEALKRVGDNEYKKELINEFSKEGQPISFYKSGEFEDLCRGGHFENPKEQMKNFKLLSIAGAYWRGDEKNKMLTRIYGTAFPTKEELEKYLWQLEEAKKRDHKKLGKELDLFTFSDLVGPGLPLWTPKGTILRDLLDGFVWELRKERGYMKVAIPHITKKELYETSGHWTKFANELFKIKSREGHEFAMKPMNCPHHTQIFAHVPRSYKDMPQRYTETTMVYRDEQTGELSGLSRVRSVTQDDAHVFARRSQMKEEFEKVWDIVEKFYGAFGFELRVRLSLHDPKNMSAYLGTPELWAEAEGIIREIAQDKKANYFEGIGEAAFYGPKVDFMAKDAIGREHQVATIQLDINMPERFNLFCINEKGEEERIVMIHAAIMGSIERFLSVLIEHVAGAFPVWLSPVQVAIMPVADRHLEIAQQVKSALDAQNVRVELNGDNKTLGSKIREATLQKVPYMVIIGDKEQEKSKNGKMEVSVRTREGKDLGSLELNNFISQITDQIEQYK
jgi:threonyl-tRNA synthetase